MKNLFLSIIIGCSLLMSKSLFSQVKESLPIGFVERKSKALDSIVNINAKIEVIAGGFIWVEGPVWVEDKKMLLISDVLKNIVYKWTSRKGKEI